jgi:DNA-binding transcriptional MerR regulator
MSKPPITLGTISRRTGLPVWKIRRVFERGLLPEPQRVGAYRVIDEADYHKVEAVLRSAGYLPAQKAEVASC